MDLLVDHADAAATAVTPDAAAPDAPEGGPIRGPRCQTAADCPTNWVCDAQTNQCAESCESDAQCRIFAYPVCSQTRHICVQCDVDADCAGPFTAMLTLTCHNNACVECTQDDDCHTNRKFCDRTLGLCEECHTDGDCQGGTCVGLFRDFLRVCQPQP